MPTAFDCEQIARRLLDEHQSGMNFWPFAAALGIRDLDAAYAVQGAFVAEMMAGRSGQRAGYKIGLTSKRMQEMCRIDTPIGGVVLPGRVHESGTVLDRVQFGRLGLEFEIGVRLGRDLPASAAPFDVAAVAAAVDAVAPAIEVVDDRNCDYKTLDVLSLVADNSWNAGIVHGAFVASWPDLETVVGNVLLDGAPADRGMGKDVLGHPFIPLAWLANHLAAGDGGLRAGEIVLTGSLVTTRFPTSPGRFRFEASGLGAVDVAVI
jgi:2-keto-4-pentenoate hydratase